MSRSELSHLIAIIALLLITGCPAGDDDDVGDDDSAADDDTGDDDTGDDDVGDDDSAAASLEALRVEIPCVAGHEGYSCAPQGMDFEDSATVAGDADTTYVVTVRFRGVIEYNSYNGGTADGLWYTGGACDDQTYNVYSLSVTSPSATYFLNADQAGIEHCWAVDYLASFQAQGGADVILYANTQDYALIINRDSNGDPIVVPDIPPYPEAFDGQFLQMDVVDVVEVEE